MRNNVSSCDRFFNENCLISITGPTFSSFKKTAEEQGVKDYDKNIAAKLIKQSAPVVKETAPIKEVGLIRKFIKWIY